MNAVLLDTVGLLALWEEDDQLGVTQAFTNDRHFVAAGFEVLF
jgi:hypothetical protein